MSSKRYSGTNLIYGELPKWYELQVRTNLENAYQLYEYLRKTKQNLLTAYISFVLSKIGYNNTTILDMHPFEKDDEIKTTKFSINDWVKHINAFSCWEEYKDADSDALYEMIERHSEDWSVAFMNDFEEKRIVSIVSRDPNWFFLKLTHNGRTALLHEHFYNDMDKSGTHFVIPEPDDYNLFKIPYDKFGQIISNKFGYLSFHTVDGLLHHLIQDDVKKAVIKEDWIKIRNILLTNIQSEYPFLYRASHSNRIERIHKYVKNAESKFAFNYQSNYRDVISDSAIVCEEILTILYEINIDRINPNNRLTLNDMINQLKPVLNKQYTKNTYHDLHFIRMWRNPSVHASEVEPDELNTFQVLSRMKLFYEQFIKNMEEMT